ncbi:MAG: hypothetical protein RIC35_03445 [Marinoscillum sp.]
MIQNKEDIDKKLDTLWNDHKDQVQETSVGTYIDVDNLTIRDAGLSTEDIMSPGNLSTWKTQRTGGRYFSESFGPGRTRLFRK